MEMLHHAAGAPSRRVRLTLNVGQKESTVASEFAVSVELANHAKAAAEMVLAEYGQELDFSEPTVGAVAAILNALRDGGDTSDDFLETAALLFGSYTGEVVRHAFRQASWHRTTEELRSAVAFLRVNGIDLFPIVWCQRQLRDEQESSVDSKYIAYREAINAGESIAKPKPFSASA
jgi:hypothetical protein